MTTMARRMRLSRETESLLIESPGKQSRHIILVMLTAAGFLFAGCLLPSKDPGEREQESFALEHGKLILRLENAGIKSRSVLEALRAVSRHHFVPEKYAGLGYLDRSIPVTPGVELPKPSVLAKMMESLDPGSDNKALQVGTGTGYQAALLSKAVSRVYSVELLPSMSRDSAERLKRLGYGNVDVKCGDPLAGWQEQAPYDRILVTIPVAQLPQALVNQLRENGRIVYCRGNRLSAETIVTVFKKDGEIITSDSSSQNKEGGKNEK